MISSSNQLKRGPSQSYLTTKPNFKERIQTGNQNNRKPSADNAEIKKRPVTASYHNL